MSGQEWGPSFYCTCGVLIRALNQETQTITYFPGEGESARSFDYPGLVAWARGNLAGPHPMRAWCEGIHRYEREA